MKITDKHLTEEQINGAIEDMQERGLWFIVDALLELKQRREMDRKVEGKE